MKQITDQKQKAIDCLNQLGIYKPYIRAFQAKTQKVCLFENYGGFYIEEDTEPKLHKKIKEIEANRGCIVYAVTHEIAEFGEMYSFLLVPQYQEDWQYLITPSGDLSNTNYAFAFVWNVDNPELSEFGDVLVRSYGGGIKRLG